MGPDPKPLAASDLERGALGAEGSPENETEPPLADWPKIYRAFRVYRAYRVYRVYKVYRVYRVYRAYRVYRVYRV